MNILTRIADKMMSGRYAMLITFGMTICFMASASLIAVLFLGKTDDKFISIVTFFGGYLTGAFSKMWDSYTYRTDRPKQEKQEDKKGESNV